MSEGHAAEDSLRFRRVTVENVWSAARVQEEFDGTRSSLRKCIRPLVENGLRAHDDDPRVPVLVNRHGRERPYYDTGSRARHLTVFSSFLFFCRLLRSELQSHFV